MIAAVKGMNDIVPGAKDPFLDSAVWAHIYHTTGDVLGSFGYVPIWLPAVEETALFVRGIGTATDIVSKEMYSFSDRGERHLTLRPEGTAGAARAYVQHNFPRTQAVQRWWYAGPMFRAERPQKGRYRQFYQIGAELFGVDSVAADVEMLQLLHSLCQRLRVTDVLIRINSLGDAASRAAYRSVLVTFLQRRVADLCDSCQGRYATNPLRVLDCKRPQCQAVMATAPDIQDSLSPTAAAAFGDAQRMLDAAGLPYKRDSRLVRGLDYYTGLIFEFTTAALGAQDTIVGGGRYDSLVQELGGPATPAVGFAAGVERLALLVSAAGGVPSLGPHLYIGSMDPESLRQAFVLAQQIRQCSACRVEVDVAGGKLKQQIRHADRVGAQFVLVVGAQERQAGRGQVKNLRTGETTEVDLAWQSIVTVLDQGRVACETKQG